MEKLLVFFRRREERNWCQQSFNQRVYAQNSMRKEGRGSPVATPAPPPSRKPRPLMRFPGWLQHRIQRQREGSAATERRKEGRRGGGGVAHLAAAERGRRGDPDGRMRRARAGAGTGTGMGGGGRRLVDGVGGLVVCAGRHVGGWR